MIRKLTLALGFGAGYVLGAKAGTERYDQIEAKVRELLGQPAVQDFTNNVTSTATAAADKAKATVNDTVSTVGDKVSAAGDKVSAATEPSSTPVADEIVVVDLGAPGAATTGPVLGASASSTAPDVL